RCLGRSGGAQTPGRCRPGDLSARATDAREPARLPDRRDREVVADHQGREPQGGMIHGSRGSKGSDGRRQMRTTWRLDRKRRRFRQQAGAAAALGPLLLSERTIAQTRTVYVNSWGGSYTAAQDAAFFKPFTAATGIQVRTVTPVAYGKIKAQVQTRTYEFDM